jgi:hypothetical protein
MAKFRKKPVVINAYQLDLDKQRPGTAWWTDVAQWADTLGANYDNWVFCSKDGIEINTLEGVMKARPGDWIICGVEGEFYPCKAEIFEATYEAVSEESNLQRARLALQAEMKRIEDRDMVDLVPYLRSALADRDRDIATLEEAVAKLDDKVDELKADKTKLIKDLKDKEDG